MQNSNNIWIKVKKFTVNQKWSPRKINGLIKSCPQQRPDLQIQRRLAKNGSTGVLKHTHIHFYKQAQALSTDRSTWTGQRAPHLDTPLIVYLLRVAACRSTLAIRSETEPPPPPHQSDSVALSWRSCVPGRTALKFITILQKDYRNWTVRDDDDGQEKIRLWTPEDEHIISSICQKDNLHAALGILLVPSANPIRKCSRWVQSSSYHHYI